MKPDPPVRQDNQAVCPTCSGSKDPRATQCWACYQAARVVTRYATTTIAGHPLADRRGRIYLHRLVVFEAGIRIPPGAHVHHRNGNTLDNRLENLEVLAHGDHGRLHGQRLTDAQKAGLQLGGVVSGEKRRRQCLERGTCPKGHIYDAANTYMRADGRRSCRTCARDRKRRERVEA